MERRLAAILAADVVGYSRLVSLDEVGTLDALKAHRRELIDQTIARYHGRIAKLTGDGLLAEFPSVVGAVECAVEIQRGMADRNREVASDRRIEFRIGINSGDIIFEDDDIFGDGVIVAVRLEGIAQPGGIAVSSNVRDEVIKRLKLSFEELGEQRLKNVPHTVRAFHISISATSERSSPPVKPQNAQFIRPSLAILPFTTFGGDPEQEGFCSGLIDDLSTSLAKTSGLTVVSRNAINTARSKDLNTREMAGQLGVRYVVEGSIRRAGARLRINILLAEGSAATQIWAEKFEGSLDDAFDLQDRICESVVAATEAALRHFEIQRARQKQPDALDAYDLFLQAIPYSVANTPIDGETALDLLNRSLTLDSGRAAAHAYKAWCHQQRYFRGGFHGHDRTEALKHASIALSLGTDDHEALAIAGFVEGIIRNEFDSAIDVLNRALKLNSSSALALRFSALMHVFSHRYERGERDALKALHLSPLEPMNYHAYLALSFAYFCTGRFEQAVANAALGMQAAPGFSVLHAFSIASLVKLGRNIEATEAAETLVNVAPRFSVESFLRMGFVRPVAHLLEDCLNAAGLPP